MIQDKAYPHFYENQVLSEDHLNSLVQYLELEDRESRIVDGSGIRCGLNVTRHAGSTKIRLSSGAGTTTQGFLVTNLSEKEYSYYQEFVLPEESEDNYLYLNGDTKIKLYELLETNIDPFDESELNKNAHAIGSTLTPAPEVNINLVDMAVILHLEIVSADMTKCKIDSCDNEGFKYQLNWRALLIAKSDLKLLIKQDLGFSQSVSDYFLSKYKVHEARIPVPKFNCMNTQAYAQIHQNYLYVCKLGVKHLLATFEKVETAYQRSLPELTVDFNGDKLLQNLFHYENNPEAPGIQYFYDHLKDIALALNEFANAAFEYHYNCTLDRERYPNYLMAGSFRPGNYQDLRDDPYRHYFEIYCRDTASTNAHKELVNLYKRVNTLITAYTTNFVQKSKTLVPQQQRLFINPESRQTNKLGDLVPPYYYGNPQSLLLRWNPATFARVFRHDMPYYWGRQNDNAADWIKDSNSTLRFRLDSHNCYHMEGHVGMTRAAFRAAFLKLKKQFNLDVDLKILEAKHVEDCKYEQPYDMLHELLEMFDIEGKQIDCYLTKLFDMFKVEYQVETDTDDEPDPGLSKLQRCVNILKKAYKTIKGKFDIQGKYYKRSLLEEFIAGLKLRCPADKTLKTPSYYVVDLLTAHDEYSKLGGKIKIDTYPPLLIEHSSHHGKLANVLYTDGTVETLNISRAAYQNLVAKYVLDDEDRPKVGGKGGSYLERVGFTMHEDAEIVKKETAAGVEDLPKKADDKVGGANAQAMARDKAMAVEEEGTKEEYMADEHRVDATSGGGKAGSNPDEPYRILITDETEGADKYSAVMNAAKNAKRMLGVEAHKDAVETIDVMIKNAGDIRDAEELKKLKGVFLGGWYGSATEEEKEDVPLPTITVVDAKKSYTFYDYDYSVAVALGGDHEIDKLMSMLAGLIYNARKTFNDDGIENPDTTVTAYLDQLIDLSKIIAETLETWELEEGEIEIHKCLLLPIIIGIFQFCWAGNFLSIKKKYVDAKASILEPIALPQYVHKNPEIKHIGGAPAGGTLIAVFKAYDESSLYDDFKDIDLPIAWNGYSPSLMNAYEDYVGRLGQGLTEVSGPRQEVIVADFSLPYRCCADTSSVEYVVFVELQLDFEEEVCNETDRVLINFSPDVAIPSGDHVELDSDDGLYYFNSGGLAAGAYEIMLSLSDRNLKKTISVFEHPSATYTVAPKTPDPESGEDEWVFRAEESGMIFKWFRRDLAEGDEIFDEVDDAIINDSFTQVGLLRSYTVDVESDQPLDFELVLLVVNGPCRVYSKPQRLTYSPAIQWSLSPTVFCNDLVTVPLAGEPGDAVLKGVGDLEDKVEFFGGQYVIHVNGVPQDEYKINMSLEDSYEDVPIRVLESPSSAFIRKDDDPEELEDGNYRWVFVVTPFLDKHEYQWLLDGEALPGQTGKVYNHDWDPRLGTSGRVELQAANRWDDDICESTTGMDIDYPPYKEPTGSITGPKMVCADTGLKPVVYSPKADNSKVVGKPGSKYVEFNPENGDAFINTAGLKRGTVYPVFLLINDTKVAELEVATCLSPNTGFYGEPGTDQEKKRKFVHFVPEKYVDSYKYEWISREKVIAEGKEYRHYWVPDVNSTLKISLRVSTEECTAESEEQVFVNHDGGSLHLESLEYHLGTILSVYEDDAKIPGDIREYVEKIVDTNREILKNITPSSDDIDRKDYALSKLDAGSITRRIGSNLEYTNMILDKLHYLDFTTEERGRVETFIKATVLSTSEILLAKTKDLDESTGAYDYLINVTPKLVELFDVDEAAEPNPELMERKKKKVNIGGFIEVVGKL